jgi:hypothetical protein
MTHVNRLFAGFLATTSLIAFPAFAQDATPQPEPSAEASADAELTEEELDAEEIVVVGRRDPNAVIGDIPPENQLDAADIRALGATSVEELLDAIAPQVSSSRGRDGGRPVMLLNGKRISGFREVRDLPPEAILRMDILPEEVALKYGYRADQRVVNIVLRPRFRSTTAEIEGELPTAGGRSESEVDLSRLMIGENGRTTVNFHAERETPLTEDERLILFQPDDPDELDPRGLRTLSGSQRLVRVGGTVNRNLGGTVSGTLDGQVEYRDGRSLLGPSLVNLGDPLQRDTNSLTGHAGLALNGNLDRWRWSLTGAYDIDRSRTETDRENDVLGLITDRARSVSRSGELDLVANGPLVNVPAGTANVTVRVGGDTRDLDSRAMRFGEETLTDLGRDEVSASVNLDLPIARRDDVLGALGNLSVNANAEVERLSDFGTLTTLGGGLFWSPLERLNLIASYTREEGSPSLAQLGSPLLSTPNARIFDFVTGRDATVELISGGNPELEADSRRVLKLGLNFRPWEERDLDFRADYTRSRTSNPISGFPGPTAAIEAAFPDRFDRDTEGNLTRVDTRPVNFDSAARDEFKWGFNFSKSLPSARPSPAQIAQMRQRAGRSGNEGQAGAGEGPRSEAAPGGRGPGGGGFGGFGGGRQGGRLQLSVFHTLILKDEVRIAPGLPVLDYLGGEAASGGAGRSRHQLEVNGGWFNNGLGTRISANWQSGSEVTGGESGTLEFAPLLKVNANVFANLGQRFDLVSKYPVLRGTQVRFSVDNIFDNKQRVRDAAGFVPVNYQPDLLDPQGRTVRLTLRKLFLPPRGAGRRDGAAARPES